MYKGSHSKDSSQYSDEDKVVSPCDLMVSGYTSPSTNLPSPSQYRKISQNQTTYLAYVVALRDPLNFHLDIYWSEETSKKYSGALNYEYSFVSEELSPQMYRRTAYSCHLKGVEIVSTGPDDFSNMKEAYIYVSKRIAKSNGWVLISVGDIDIYQRILINMFDVIKRKSLNHKLLSKKSERTTKNIAREYVRPNRNKNIFAPDLSKIQKDYHIVFSNSSKSKDSTKTKLPNSLIQS